jgi:hypothetical protein
MHHAETEREMGGESHAPTERMAKSDPKQMQGDKCFPERKKKKVASYELNRKGGEKRGGEKRRRMEQCMEGDGPCWRLELEEVGVEELGWWLASWTSE